MSGIRRAQWSLAVAAFALGALHLALTLPIYGGPSLEALWFAGSGLAILAVASINVVSLRAGANASRLVVLSANAVMAAYFAFAWPLIKGPQVVVGLVIFAGLAGCAIGGPRRSHDV